MLRHSVARIGGKVAITTSRSALGRTASKNNTRAFTLRTTPLLSKTQSWAPTDEADIERVTIKAMIHELKEDQESTINKTVPWFLDNMPPAYFRQVGYSTRLDHVKAITSLRGADMEMSLSMKSVTADDRRVVTFISPSNQPGLILSQLASLPSYSDRSLSRVQIYTSNDNSMCLNMYTYGEGLSGGAEINPVEIAGPILSYAEKVQNGGELNVTPTLTNIH